MTLPPKPPPSADEYFPKAGAPPPFQYGLFSIFLFTTICAAVLAVVRLLPPVLKWILLGYCVVAVVYMALRLPFLLRTFWRVREIRDRKRELNEWAQGIRAKIDAERSDSDGDA